MDEYSKADIQTLKKFIAARHGPKAVPWLMDTLEEPPITLMQQVHCDDLLEGSRPMCIQKSICRCRNGSKYYQQKERRFCMASDINAILNSFKEELLRQEKSKNTVRAYIRDVEEFIQWFSETVGEFSPEQITVVDVQEYKSYLYNVKRNKPVSVNRKLSALEKFCEFLVSTGHLKDNPAAKVKKIKVQKIAQFMSLTNSDLYKFKRMVYLDGNKRNIAIFELMINTGLREAEVCNLKLDDVFISERKGYVVVRAGKGDKYRKVPLNANARRAIQAYLEVRPNRGNYLFVSNKSERLSESQLYRIIRKYAEMAGIKAHPHMLRHTFATKLLREGRIDLPTLQNLLGHANINTTAVYTRANMQDLEKAVEILENLED